MGFLDHSTNNIIVDAVLTDHGRKKIAEQGTSSNIIQGYSFADDEIDYTIIKKYGLAVGKEKIEKNTPIFEASTAESNGVTFFLYTSDSGGSAIGTTLSIDYSAVAAPASNSTSPGRNNQITLQITPTNLSGTRSVKIAYDNRYVSPSGNVSSSNLYPSDPSSSHLKYFTVSLVNSTQVLQAFTVDSSLNIIASTNQTSSTLLSVGVGDAGVSPNSISLTVTKTP